MEKRMRLRTFTLLGFLSVLAVTATADSSFGRLPLSFESDSHPNGAARFISRPAGYSLLLTSSEVVLRPKSSQSLLRLRLVGANPVAKISGLEQMPGHSNYLLGNDPTQWRTDVPHFAKVRYEQIYPGVDLLFYGNPGQLEYDFIVAPGANPEAIRLEIQGARKMT